MEVIMKYHPFHVADWIVQTPALDDSMYGSRKPQTDTHKAHILYVAQSKHVGSHG